MLTIHTDIKIHNMSRDNVPVAYAKSGDMIRFETLDCFGGQIPLSVTAAYGYSFA